MNVTDINCWAGVLLTEAAVATPQHHDELLHGTTSTIVAEGCHLSGTNCIVMVS